MTMITPATDGVGSNYGLTRESAVNDPACRALIGGLQQAAFGRLLNPDYYGDEGDLCMDVAASVAAVREVDRAAMSGPVELAGEPSSEDEVTCWLCEVRAAAMATLRTSMATDSRAVPADRGLAAAVLWLADRVEADMRNAGAEGMGVLASVDAIGARCV